VPIESLICYYGVILLYYRYHLRHKKCNKKYDRNFRDDGSELITKTKGFPHRSSSSILCLGRESWSRGVRRQFCLINQSALVTAVANYQQRLKMNLHREWRTTLEGTWKNSAWACGLVFPSSLLRHPSSFISQMELRIGFCTRRFFARWSAFVFASDELPQQCGSLREKSWFEF